MHSPDCLRLIIRTALEPIGKWSPAAEELLLMTAAHESVLGRHLRQIDGPARGIYGMEPATEHDIWHTWLHYRQDLKDKVTAITGTSGPDLGHLQYNPIYATIMARIKYLRAPGQLPPQHDHWAMAEYAKDHYNTIQGKASPAKYYNDYRRLVLG